MNYIYLLLEKEMATHSSVLAWRIPGMVEHGGLSSMGSHWVGHDWSNLAAAAAYYIYLLQQTIFVDSLTESIRETCSSGKVEFIRCSCNKEATHIDGLSVSKEKLEKGIYRVLEIGFKWFKVSLSRWDTVKIGQNA